MLDRITHRRWTLRHRRQRDPHQIRPVPLRRLSSPSSRRASVAGASWSRIHLRAGGLSASVLLRDQYTFADVSAQHASNRSHLRRVISTHGKASHATAQPETLVIHQVCPMSTPAKLHKHPYSVADRFADKLVELLKRAVSLVNLDPDPGGSPILCLLGQCLRLEISQQHRIDAQRLQIIEPHGEPAQGGAPFGRTLGCETVRLHLGQYRVRPPALNRHARAGPARSRKGLRSRNSGDQKRRQRQTAPQQIVHATSVPVPPASLHVLHLR